jgi:DNA-directed RNA polymerase subunit beta'
MPVTLPVGLVTLHRMLLLLKKTCGTLRGIATSVRLKDNEEVVDHCYDRIIGRTSLHNIYNPFLMNYRRSW